MSEKIPYRDEWATEPDADFAVEPLPSRPIPLDNSDDGDDPGREHD